MKKHLILSMLCSVALATAPSLVAAQEEADVEVEEEANWYDDISAGIFADAFYMADWNRPGSPVAFSTGAPAAGGAIPHRAYDFAHGFALAFGGVDLAYSGEKAGATISLRYGAGAAGLIGNPNAVLANLAQAYATWTPTDSLSLDIGTFGTIYGAEVAESWMNLNYTRGALYFLMQPFYHTGLRGSYQINDMVGVTAMVVNGTNLNGGAFQFGEDGNQSPHLGFQVGLTPVDAFALAVGYYTGAGASGFGAAVDGPTEDDDWEHFIDVVATVDVGDLSIVGNADFYVGGPDTDIFYYGLSAAVGYSITDEFGIAGRVEFLGDPDVYISGLYETLVTGTVTLDYTPVENLIIRLDNRFEYSDEEIYQTNDDTSQTAFTTTLGVVAQAGY